MKSYFLQIKEVIKETNDTKTIEFWHPISEQIKYKAGQFITVVLTDTEGKKVKRSYSMSSSPNSDSAVAITIKRVSGGFMSNYLNDKIKAGDFLEVIEPMGTFFTEPQTTCRNVFLVGAGSGITPLMSILKTILKTEPSSKVHLLYGSKDPQNTIFKSSLDSHLELYNGRFSVKYIYSQYENKSRINEGIFDQWSQAAGFNSTIDQVYICGPEAMMTDIRSYLEKRNVDSERVHYERFNAPASELSEDTGTDNRSYSVKVIYDGETHQFDVAPHQTILEAALELGIDLPYSCQAGMCTACMGKCTQGSTKMDEEDGLTEKEIASGYLLTCVAHPTSTNVVIEID